MNLTTLKAQAEAAKTDSVELELWRESIEPDEFLRLVEVARAAVAVKENYFSGRLPRLNSMVAMNKTLEGIEP